MSDRLGLQGRPLRLLRHAPLPLFPRPTALPLRHPAHPNPRALPPRAAQDPASPRHRDSHGVLPPLHNDRAEGEVGIYMADVCDEG